MTRSKLSATDIRNLRTLLLASVFEPGAIGRRIAEARIEAGLIQQDLADLVGVSTRMVQHYEAGTSNPYRHIRQLAEVLGTSVKWLLHGEPEDDSATLSQVRGEVAEVRALLVRVLESRGELPAREPERDAEDS